jgi:hypothetical protein
MRARLTTVAALGAACFCAWVAAPALSLQPYMPGAKDFEAAIPDPKRIKPLAAASAIEAAHGHRREEQAAWISPPVAAPERFDLVGVAREMREVEIRVRDSGGEWSEWVPQGDGTPVYVDGADEAQVRAAFRPVGELHFVNVSGTTGGLGERMLNSARGAVNNAFVAIASTPVAEAISNQPKIVPRSAWGADLAAGGCPPREPAQYGTVSAGVIHHTVNANDYTAAEAPGIVLGICRFHRNANGWNDIGYNALVDRFGKIYEGRAGGLTGPVLGAQAQGFNAQTTSIASIGDYTTTQISKKARGAIIKFLAWKLKLSRATPVTALTKMTSAGGPASRYTAGTVISVPRIVGHGTLGLTECPGATLTPQVVSIREAVQKRLKARRVKKKR